MNDERVTQGMIRSVWAMTKTTELHIPAVVGNGIDEEEAAMAAQASSRRQHPNGPPRPIRNEGRKERTLERTRKKVSKFR